MTELRTIQETADQLRLGRRTVERYLATGEIRSVRLGRRRMVSQQEIDRFLKLAERRGRLA